MINEFCEAMLATPDVEFNGALYAEEQERLEIIADFEEQEAREARRTPEERAAIKAEEEKWNAARYALYHKVEPVRKLEDCPGATMAEKRLSAMIEYNRLKE